MSVAVAEGFALHRFCCGYRVRIAATHFVGLAMTRGDDIRSALIRRGGFAAPRTEKLRRTACRPRAVFLSLRNFRTEKPAGFSGNSVPLSDAFIKRDGQTAKSVKYDKNASLTHFYQAQGSFIKYIAPPDVITAVLSVVMPITSFTCMGRA